MGSGKAPAKTAEQKAMERAQREQLDQETASSERRLKAIAQKQLGKESLLGTPMEQAEGPAGPTITKGYEATSSGGLRKTPKQKSLFGRLFKSGVMGGVGTSGSLIGKGAQKTVKKAMK